jgi:hypothetical protein
MGMFIRKTKREREVYVFLSRKKLATIVGKNGTLMENTVQWVILKGLLGGDLGVANIYAPNILRDRCFLWAEMIQKLPRGCRWILVGDWNMVERSINKSNTCGQLISQAKRLS